MLPDNVTKPINTSIYGASGECPIVIHVSREKDPGFPIALHTHHKIEIQYIKRGKGEYFIKDRNYSFHKDALLVIGPDEIHRFVPQPELYVEKYCFHFAIDFLGDNSYLADLPPGFPRLIELPEREATAIELIIRDILEEKDAAKPYWLEVVRSELVRLLLLIKRAGAIIEDHRQENPVINSILKYIEDNFRQELTLNQVAEHFSLSPNYLSRLFKQITGLNFKHYIIQRQIAEAKRLLEDYPERKASAIARDIGQPNYIMFNRNFKKLTGLTPSNYRRII